MSEFPYEDSETTQTKVGMDGEGWWLFTFLPPEVWGERDSCTCIFYFCFRDGTFSPGPCQILCPCLCDKEMVSRAFSQEGDIAWRGGLSGSGTAVAGFYELTW